jgi:hypothetical protein
MSTLKLNPVQLIVTKRESGWAWKTYPLSAADSYTPEQVAEINRNIFEPAKSSSKVDTFRNGQG